ncbi:DUF5103 domain-containing protein [Flammeovirgaceae bacterium SG7u.111]|nr:DUF5103 domain-containing protein [Flammeovirgaceae bacterium SG7u.132]WPO34107.1 DUF5103 domain-containing protein [Flammeovirgaceae bacterium SG7u.111]
MANFYFRVLLTGLLVIGSASSSFAQLEQWLSRHDYAVDKRLRYENYVYENTIRTVRLYPLGIMPGELTDSPMIPLSQPYGFLLEFDELAEDADQYKVKFVHCNFDWKSSQLQPIEYLHEYNEFYIMDLEYSMNSKVDYVHYMYRLPRFKVSGNYLMIVYRENEDDIIITRRFVIYEETATIGARVEDAMGSEEGRRNQVVKFEINYGGIQLDRPEQNVFVALRQNYRWDNAIMDLKPLFVKEFQGVLDYNYFNRENEFSAGNEFRVVDFRDFSTFNIKTVNRFTKMDQVIVLPEKPRTGRVYNRMDDRDLNGRFLIRSSNTQDAHVEGDYVEVIFTLETPDQYKDGYVYILGSFNDWHLELENQMQYVPNENAYKASMLMKQGRYDYYYVIYNPETGKRDELTIESSHSDTSNEYDIIAYYRSIGSRGDRVIGYKSIRKSRR